MLSVFILSVIIITNVCAYNVQPWQNNTNKNFIYNIFYYDTLIDVTVNKTTTQVLDFKEASDHLSEYPTRIHVGTNDTITVDYPLFVTATQQKSVSSWELPLVVSTRASDVLQFNDMARNLCPHDAGPNITSQTSPTVTVSTSSPTNLTVRIKLRRVQDFFVLVNKEVSLNVTPSSPKYYYFSFDRDPWNLTKTKHSNHFPRFNYTIPKSVLLTINSDDKLCAVISIQNNSCPVFDNEENMLYQGYHFTMLTKGGITITQSMFPSGFYIVFIVKERDEECTGISDSDSVRPFSNKRMKNFRFTVVATVTYSDYITGVLATLTLMLVVAILGPVVNAVSCKQEEIVIIEEEQEVSNEPSTSHTEPTSSGIEPGTSDTVPIMEPLLDREDSNSNEWDLESEPDINRTLPMPLTVAGLSRARPVAQRRRSNRYFWSALTVAVVYALPVVQLLFTYQQMIFQTGDQDLCYYNFLCAHPLGMFSDSNHVYSNMGYVILGVTFMLQTKFRKRPRDDNDQELGIPQHRGLLYSMGLALVMEGVLSACYHLCPNKMNFQFDSSFMYVIAVLCMVKLYQSRHSDVNASAHVTFMLLALLMAIGFYGIMYPSVWFWSIFTIVHLIVCFYLTLKIYYVNRLKMEPNIVGKAWAGLKQYGFSAFKPNYRARAVVLIVANIANCVLAIYGVCEHNKDFARHLLYILMGNAILYNLGYVVLKVLHGERLPAAAWLWLALAAAAWTLAIILFLDARTKWSETAAQSRTHNAACSALHTLDTHDLWHLASAAAIFFSFNALLIMDDPLANTPRRSISVF